MFCELNDSVPFRENPWLKINEDRFQKSEGIQRRTDDGVQIECPLASVTFSNNN